MNEYINKEAVLNHLNACKEDPLFNPDMARICFAISIFIENMQAADVQPVVHCKDCKHRTEHHYEEEGEPPYIKYGCKFTKYSMSDEGFCSFGVRK